MLVVTSLCQRQCELTKFRFIWLRSFRGEDLKKKLPIRKKNCLWQPCFCCFFAKHAALRRKSKDWLARNQNNVSEWSDIFTRCLLLPHFAKGNVSYYHHLALVVRRLSFVVCRSLTIHILIFSSAVETMFVNGSG
jgi:hypothetical protein